MADVRSVHLSVGGRRVELRSFHPSNDTGERYVVWVHGGGWKEGTLDGNERLMRVLANSSECVVVGVEYSKVPECRFPTQIDELYEACRHIDGSLFPDRQTRSIAGYSAGANLVLAVMAKYDSLFPKNYFAGAGLICGVYGVDFETPSYRRYADAPFGRSRTSMIEILDDYAPGAIERQDPLVFPIDANPCACRDFLIVSAEHDLLRDDSAELARRLSSQGVDATHHQVPGVTHIFIQRSMRVQKAQSAIERVGTYLSGRSSG